MERLEAVREIKREQVEDYSSKLGGDMATLTTGNISNRAYLKVRCVPVVARRHTLESALEDHRC